MAQPVTPGQRKKLTPPEMYEAMLRVVNSMNVSLSTAISKLNEAYQIDYALPDSGLNSERMGRISEQLNKVMNGITSFTSIYTEARQRAIIEQGPVAAAVAAGTQDSSVQTRAEAIAKVTQQTINAANRFKAGIEGVSSRVSQMVESTVAAANEAVSPQLVQQSIPRNSLDELLGEDGLMFSYLSAELHASGKGALRPSDRFHAFIEDLSQVPIEDLVDYPEGFYNTRDTLPSQLYLKVGTTEFLWNFGLPEREMFLRNDSEWRSMNTLTRSTVRMMTNQLASHLELIIKRV